MRPCIERLEDRLSPTDVGGQLLLQIVTYFPPSVVLADATTLANRVDAGDAFLKTTLGPRGVSAIDAANAVFHQTLDSWLAAYQAGTLVNGGLH